MRSMLSRELEPVTYGFWRPLLRQLDEMFDQQASQNREQVDAGQSDYVPNHEVDQTEEHYVMSFDVPGIHRDDLNIEVTGNRLLVSGERKPEGRSGSRRYGKFQRLFTLPDGVTADDVVAEHKDGVLRLAIQKPAAAKAIKIKIADGAAQTREGGFFKNLVSGKRQKDTIEIKGATSRNDSVAMAN